MLEGTAVYVSALEMEKAGAGSSQSTMACRAKSFPPAPSLRAIEPVDAWRAAAASGYTTAAFAMADLIAGQPARLKTYWEATASGADWPVAFERAFGRTPAAFYDTFEPKIASISSAGCQ
jgi:hypothetical protein